MKKIQNPNLPKKNMLKIFEVQSKIVSTLGPVTFSEDMLIKLREKGVDIFRINLSHASKEGKEVIELFSRIRKVTPDLGILCDIQGPKIRLGEVDNEILLKYGDKFTVYEEPKVGCKEFASIPYKGFFKDVHIGDNIFINDGLVRLKIKKKDKKNRCVITKVIAGGPISSRKGVNIPASDLSMKNPTEKDIRDLKLISTLNPEYLAASFIANAKEVKHIRSILENYGASKIKIISKIERPIALENFDEILEDSDGIMVARGDLGVEIPAEEVPIRQKEIIIKCNRAGKPVIVATQMLESMTKNPVPTRAEVNDVFNAVYDRTDAVMLSGETSIGKFPTESVSYMDKIISKAEKYIPTVDPSEIDPEEPKIYDAVGHAIYELAKVFQRVNFRGKIVMFTRGGKSCRKAARYRPTFTILALTNRIKTARQLKMIWGVQPFFISSLDMEKWKAEKIMQYGISKLVEFGILELKEHVICSVPSCITPSRCSVIGLYYVQDILNEVDIKKRSYNIDNK